MSKQLPVLRQILPIPPIESSAAQDEETSEAYLPEHICEPSTDELLSEMLPRNVYAQIYGALLETSTSEHAARMMAMDNATQNAEDLIDELTLVLNKVRQASITKELLEIMTAVEALSKR